MFFNYDDLLTTDSAYILLPFSKNKLKNEKEINYKHIFCFRKSIDWFVSNIQGDS